jgi:hypothetical protein
VEERAARAPAPFASVTKHSPEARLSNDLLATISIKIPDKPEWLTKYIASYHILDEVPQRGRQTVTIFSICNRPSNITVRVSTQTPPPPILEK